MHREFPAINDKPRAYLYIDYLMCYLRYGAVLDQYIRGGFYRLTAKERKKSVTYRRISKVYDVSITPEYIHYLQNKVDFNRHFSKLLNRRWLYSKDMTEDDFRALCDSVGELIVKPIGESEGKGVHKADAPVDESAFQELYRSLKADDVVIEERLYSHKDMKFGATSLNTIRVHSVIDADGNVHFIKFILRAGVGDTVVDNYCAGGCIYEVDEHSGRIISRSYSKKHPQSDIHPGTDIVMPGRCIPYWDDVKRLVACAHKMLPQIRFVGWDVAITDNGPELIEGNHHPDYDLLEFVGTRFWWPQLKLHLNI